MGNNEQIPHFYDAKYSLNLFEFLYVIGRGGFGRVWKVKHKQSGEIFALKEMSKLKIIDKKSEKNILSERKILSMLTNNPFIVNLIYSFQSEDNLYILMDYLRGGDLRYYISKKTLFTESQIKFFVACTLEGLESIHKKKIIHRDIKPENLVMDERGYLKITDFGISKFYKKENKEDTSGTPNYMAPEVLLGQNHNYSVDFYSLGIVAFELINGTRPYNGKNRNEVKMKVISNQAQIKKFNLPFNWSLSIADFVNGLIERKINKRLGFNGIQEIKNHKWFYNFPWENLKNKKIIPPFLPPSGDNFDKKYCQKNKVIGIATNERYIFYKNDSEYSLIFNDFTFISPNAKQIHILLNKKEKKISKISSSSTLIDNKKMINKDIGTSNTIRNNGICNNFLYNNNEIIQKNIDVNTMDYNNNNLNNNEICNKNINTINSNNNFILKQRQNILNKKNKYKKLSISPENSNNIKNRVNNNQDINIKLSRNLSYGNNNLNSLKIATNTNLNNKKIILNNINKFNQNLFPKVEKFKNKNNFINCLSIDRDSNTISNNEFKRNFDKNKILFPNKSQYNSPKFKIKTKMLIKNNNEFINNFNNNINKKLIKKKFPLVLNIKNNLNKD